MRKITQQQETEMKQFMSQQKKDYQKSKDSIKKVRWAKISKLSTKSQQFPLMISTQSKVQVELNVGVLLYFPFILL